IYKNISNILFYIYGKIIFILKNSQSKIYGKNIKNLLAPENNTSSSNMNLNTPVISQPQTSPSLPPNEGPTTSFQQSYISSFTNVNPTRNIWIKRFTDIDATKIPFSGEDVHDLKVTQLNQLNGISGLNQLNSTTSNPSTSIQTLSSLAPLSNTLVNLNSIQASLNSINATTAASLNSSTSSPLNTNIGMNNIINGLVSLQNLNNARGLTTSTFNDSLTISPNSNTDKIASNTAISTVANSTSIPSLQNSNSRPNNTNSDTNNNYLNSNSKVGSPVTVEDQNNSQHSDNEEPLDPEEQVNAIYPQNVEVPKEIEDAVHRNTNRGWRLITVIDTNDIPKFFEDQPQDWRVQRSATDRYPGYLIFIIAYIQFI
ncbi:hypothetical protein H8356DRAFT_1091140, partial [Neocallimastix lanati (nom. inval.)]